MRLLSFFFGTCFLAGAFIMLTSCSRGDISGRSSSVEQRNNSFSLAEKKFPNPKLENFPQREALIEFSKRQDLVNHPWFIYILGDNGNPIGYYVGKTRPINSCNFLSSTEGIYNGPKGDLILTAPAFDGMYYGGGSASAACNSMFFFDWNTNAMIEIGSIKYFTSDQPLALDIKPILVKDK